MWQLKILRYSLGRSWMNKIRNECIRGTFQIERLGDKVRDTRLR